MVGPRISAAHARRGGRRQTALPAEFMHGLRDYPAAKLAGVVHNHDNHELSLLMSSDMAFELRQALSHASISYADQESVGEIGHALLEDEVELLLLLLLAAPPAATVRLGARGLSVADAPGAAAAEC